MTRRRQPQRVRTPVVTAKAITMMAITVAASVAVGGSSHTSAATPSETGDHRIVDAPMIDGFRPPQCGWCPGNRGLEYDSVPGQPVTAARAGRVSFAGRVAGVGYVVVALIDGRRVTYGGIDPGRWRIGDPVARGALIGLAEGPVHLGLREGSEYIDPARLAERRPVRARLVQQLPDGT